jgi:hypothetical protein
MNPIWGQNFQSNSPFQWSLLNQPTLVGYSTQNPPQPNFLVLYNYLQTAYGPIGISTVLPPQNYQFSSSEQTVSLSCYFGFTIFI